MAPMRRLAPLALGLACCLAVTVSADTPAPILFSGGNNDFDGNAPVFLSGATLDEKDAGPATENVLLANNNGSGGAATNAVGDPVFLPGVYLEENVLTSGNSTAPGTSAAPPAAAGNATTPRPSTAAAPPTAGNATTATTNATTPRPSTAAAPPTANVLGGWPSMPAGKNEIAFLVSVLSDPKYYDPSLSFGVCFKNIFGLQYQSVAGTNFRYSGNGCLVQKGSKQMGMCSTDCAFEKIMVTIFTQDWTNTVQVKGITYVE